MNATNLRERGREDEGIDNGMEKKKEKTFDNDEVTME